MKTSQKIELCPVCGMDIAIRNPSGYCDHLYYPENRSKSVKAMLAQARKDGVRECLEALPREESPENISRYMSDPKDTPWCDGWNKCLNEAKENISKLIK